MIDHDLKKWNLLINLAIEGGETRRALSKISGKIGKNRRNVDFFAQSVHIFL